MWSLHVFPVHMWFLPEYSGFLAQAKDMHLGHGRIGDFRSTAAESECLSGGIRLYDGPDPWSSVKKLFISFKAGHGCSIYFVFVSFSLG